MSVFCHRHICACVLVSLSALMTATSPLPSSVLLQGEIGRPGSKVSRSSPPACLALPLISLWSISHALGIMGSESLSPLSPPRILNLCDVICLLMCSEYPLQLLNGSCCISLSSRWSRTAKLDHIPGCLQSSSGSSPLRHPPLLSFASASCFSLFSFLWPDSISPLYWTPVLLIQALQHSTSAL